MRNPRRFLCAEHELDKPLHRIVPVVVLNFRILVADVPEGNGDRHVVVELLDVRLEVVDPEGRP